MHRAWCIGHREVRESGIEGRESVQEIFQFRSKGESGLSLDGMRRIVGAPEPFRRRCGIRKSSIGHLHSNMILQLVTRNSILETVKICIPSKNTERPGLLGAWYNSCFPCRRQCRWVPRAKAESLRFRFPKASSRDARRPGKCGRIRRP